MFHKNNIALNLKEMSMKHTVNQPLGVYHTNPTKGINAYWTIARMLNQLWHKRNNRENDVSYRCALRWNRIVNPYESQLPAWFATISIQHLSCKGYICPQYHGSIIRYPYIVIITAVTQL